ncbi:hypothetical protein CYMTET_34236 [Cymbomonas tetramitiformis]|uniref:Uncharacterized protein n=1 Tax=Cymbomonas tetramitiformis TaxID=36881 RepID=A0AAE0FBK6_9CHLO|nr:hypothetical protein CYMTET_34236 [Cymbomonas tetramitiformis]
MGRRRAKARRIEAEKKEMEEKTQTAHEARKACAWVNSLVFCVKNAVPILLVLFVDANQTFFHDTNPLDILRYNTSACDATCQMQDPLQLLALLVLPVVLAFTLLELAVQLGLWAPIRLHLSRPGEEVATQEVPPRCLLRASHV